MANLKRNVKFLYRDFAENRTALINYFKQYFPNANSDWNESNPILGIIESIAYVSDTLHFFSDINLQESLMVNAEERKNIYNLARSFGYVPKTTIPASVDLDVFQLIPSIGEGTNTKPDFRYALYIKENMRASTTDTDAVQFYTKDAVDFRFSSSLDPTTVTTYSVTSDGAIEYYLLKKKVKATSGELKTREFQFGEPKIYDKIVIPETNVTEVISVTDSDTNVWNEVQFLAQDLVSTPIRNLPYYDPVLSQYQSSVPFLLTYKQTEHRFVTRLRSDDTFELQFGAGMSAEADEEIVPNPFNVGLGLNYFERVVDVSLDPLNFLYTKTYGTAPSDTVLTVKYAVSNGLGENVNANTITRIVESDIVDPVDSTDSVVLQTIKDSLSINNPNAAFGGLNRKPLDIVREEAMAHFAAQNRAVTKEDYILRCFTLPSKYGSVVKAYIEQDSQMGSNWSTERIPNPFSLNLYVLSYNANRQFVACNEAIKQNLRQYLKQYRMLTDSILIKDPFIINIGVSVEVITYPNENSNEVLLRVVNKMIEIFDNDNMQINAPIILSTITSQLDRIQGVMTVKRIDVENLIDTNSGYSGNQYDIKTATREGVIYPPITPSVFSVQYPKRNLTCRIVEM